MTENDTIDKFPAEVHAALGFYVYKLIDPRDGEIFYIGKGSGDRIFQHVRRGIKFTDRDNEDELSVKYQIINQIINSGLHPIQIIHRHGMNEEQSYEVEAALIDATPGLTNKIMGRGSSECGPANVKQLIDRYRAEVIEPNFNEKLILINVNQTYEERGAYEAVRYAWRLNKERAESCDYVLAVFRGVCRGVFIAEKWLMATKENFPGLDQDLPGRYGFVGRPAHSEIWKRYAGKRLAKDMLSRPGTATPIRYFPPEAR